MKKIIPPLIAITLLALVTAFSILQKKDFIDLKVAGQTFKVQIADTPEERRQGLMNRKKLASDRGMLFIYPQEDRLSFWMKDTLIPLDMIFIDADRKITHLQENAPPCELVNSDHCPQYETPVPAQYVLELNAGQSNLYGIKIGDLVEF